MAPSAGPVAQAGHRCVAMDLRGYGASDKTPRGYDPLTLAGDVAGVIRSLGSRDAVLVGQGWGAYVAWGVAASHPGHVAALCTVGCTASCRPPAARRTDARRLLPHGTCWVCRCPGCRSDGSCEATTSPGIWRPGRRRCPASRRRRSPGGTGTRWRSGRRRTVRWSTTAGCSARGCAPTDAHSLLLSRRPLQIPVLQINGAADPVVRRPAVAAAARYVRGPLDDAVIEGAGHFPHEEAPDAFTATLLRWLSGRARSGADGLA